MRLVLQRVSRAEVRVGGEVVGAIGRGLVVLVAAEKGDTDESARRLAGKVARYRVFPDDEGRMNLSVADVAANVLLVSEVTLCRQPRKGNRPSFDAAADPERAVELLELFRRVLDEHAVPVAQGRFGAMMEVDLVNDGPVTFVMETD